MRFAIAATTLVLFAHQAFAQQVSYPDDYRAWRHVKSMLLNPGHPLYESFGGLHHLYANEPALKGYQRGSFPDGSIIVFDLLEANESAGAVVEGARKVVGVMQKDAARFKSTGGWGFEGFAAGDKSKPVVGANAAKACFECHTSQKDRDFVFSSARD